MREAKRMHLRKVIGLGWTKGALEEQDQNSGKEIIPEGWKHEEEQEHHHQHSIICSKYERGTAGKETEGG